jgi:predicted branched-subunit amino acid permease
MISIFPIGRLSASQMIAASMLSGVTYFLEIPAVVLLVIARSIRYNLRMPY